MNKPLFVSLLCIILLTGLSSCFKSTPDNEMMKAGGSWIIDEIELNYFDSAGNATGNETLREGGVLMLSHNDDFLYEGTYSVSYDSAVFSRSEIGDLFLDCNIWGVSNGAKNFNLSLQDPSTGFTSLIVSFTVLKLRRNKMEIQFIRTHPRTAHPVYQEIWKLKRGTHL
ncbi:MAG: hypothetical protein MUC87_16120 [Bacteroidia bacterium]|nr:hypothetical protein [Bacteroidia bacterium]